MTENFFQKILPGRLLPAVTFPNDRSASQVAELFLKNGLDVMEIPLRTAFALAAITEIRKNFPEIRVGAGTVLTGSQLQSARDAGAMFGVSPGFNVAVCEASIAEGLPFIPGVMTPTEMESAVSAGFRVLKLFPAQQIGGASFLKALKEPYQHLGVQFIPMGGVNPKNMADYLALSNVLALGGSWLAPQDLITAEDWSTIGINVQQAVRLIKGPANQFSA